MALRRTALITGASKRIGLALSHCLHHAGFDIAIHCHQSTQLAYDLSETLNKNRSNSAKVFHANLCKLNDIEQFCYEVVQWRPTLQVLINNASIFLNDLLALPRWDDIFNCNVKAPYLLSHYCLDTLKQNHGIIINLTDIHAKSPLNDYGIYCMTKASLELQTKHLAKEFAPTVRVNAIAPGAILWPEAENELDDTIKDKLISETPLKMIGGVEPITQAALHFIENDFLTGVSLHVDGGRSL